MGKMNYISLTRIPFLFRSYVYFDAVDNLADSLFCRHKVQVYFGKEYRRNDTEYKIIYCRIRKKDEDKFLAALGELSNKMILFGHLDYDEFCQDTIALLEKTAKHGNEGRKGRGKETVQYA